MRDGTAIPRIALAQSTAQMDWSKIELAVFAKNATISGGSIFLPGDAEAHELALTKSGDHFKLDADPLADIGGLADPDRITGVWTGGRRVKQAAA